MGVLVIAAFRPRPGGAGALHGVVRDHLPMLRAEGLVTDREAIVMEARDGTLIEVFEWKSEDAIRAAHANPRVAALWARYEACCDYVPLADVPEAREMFPGYRPFDAGGSR